MLWNDQCCSGCGIEQRIDDFTPLYEDGVDELDYIEREYLDDMRERIEDYDEYLRGRSMGIMKINLQELKEDTPISK